MEFLAFGLDPHRLDIPSGYTCADCPPGRSRSQCIVVVVREETFPKIHGQPRHQTLNDTDGEWLFGAVLSRNLESVVAKRAGSA